MTSRARVVAASDEARRRIERELHDRVQTRLVALAHQVQSVAAAVPPGCEDIQAELTELAAGLMTVVRELREISGGIHPAILTEAGLRPALQSLARRSIVPVELNVQTGERMPEQAEVAAYYVVSEMLTNAARHACASAVTVTASVSGDMLQLRVADDGVGGADPARGSGLVGLKDRVEALGGTFSVHSPPGGSTTVHSRLPVTDHPGREPADPQ